MSQQMWKWLSKLVAAIAVASARMQSLTASMAPAVRRAKDGNGVMARCTRSGFMRLPARDTPTQYDFLIHILGSE
jgi:hypothetical protein